MATQSPPQQRRSSRLQFRCRVKISGVDAEDNRFTEETETVSISKFGACLRTTRNYAMGQVLSIYTVDRGHTGLFQVVWIGRDGTASRADRSRVGQYPPLLGIEFPPEDWGGR